MNVIAPLSRWTRDDWVVPCVYQDVSGTPIDLTGCIVVAELWLAGYGVFQPLTVANGGIIRVSDPAGQFTIVASCLLTAAAPGDALSPAPVVRTRVLIAMIDTRGRRQTLGVVPFRVFDGSEGLSIDEMAQVALVSQVTTLRLVLAMAQGAPGPSNIPAAQISDSGILGQGLIKSADAAAARRLLGVAAFTRAAVQDANYPAKIGDTYVGLVSLTAPRTITLPAAAEYPQGQPIYIADESGACGTDRPIVIAAAGQDTIAGQPNFSMQSPYQKSVFHSNGSSLWTL